MCPLSSARSGARASLRRPGYLRLKSQGRREFREFADEGLDTATVAGALQPTPRPSPLAYAVVVAFQTMLYGREFPGYVALPLFSIERRGSIPASQNMFMSSMVTLEPACTMAMSVTPPA